MTMTSADAAKRMNAVNNAFNKVGTTNGTSPPLTNDAAEAAAYEWHVSQALKKMAEGREKLARANAIKEGVLFDHDADPKPPGAYSVYNGTNVAIICTVKNGSVKVDSKALRTALEKAGINADVLEKAFASATTQTRPAHTFTSSLVIGEQE